MLCRSERLCATASLYRCSALSRRFSRILMCFWTCGAKRRGGGRGAEESQCAARPPERARREGDSSVAP